MMIYDHTLIQSHVDDLGLSLPVVDWRKAMTEAGWQRMWQSSGEEHLYTILSVYSHDEKGLLVELANDGTLVLARCSNWGEAASVVKRLRVFVELDVQSPLTGITAQVGRYDEAIRVVVAEESTGWR